MENNHIWKAIEQVAPERKQLETLLEKDEEVILSISCITGQEKGKLFCSGKKRKRSEDSDSEEKNVSSEGEPDLNPNAFDTANKAIYLLDDLLDCNGYSNTMHFRYANKSNESFPPECFRD